MIAQIAADARQIDGHGNAEALQCSPWADARSHQDRWRLQRACGEDHAAGIDGECLSCARDRHARRAAAFELELLDRAVGPDGEVWPRPRRCIEIGGGGGDTSVIAVGEGRRKNAVLEFGVLVILERQARR